MNCKPKQKTQWIDQLGIVVRISPEIFLIEKIDAYVKANELKVSCGKGTQAIILKALGFVS
jgi:hypothetical protein